MIAMDINPGLAKEADIADADLKEPTKAEIMADITLAFQQALAGVKGRPALEVLDEIDREVNSDADPR